jgi:hypothetical protein
MLVLWKVLAVCASLMLRLTMQGDQVKRGQTLGFIEQLGTYVPIEVHMRSWHSAFSSHLTLLQALLTPYHGSVPIAL